MELKDLKQSGVVFNEEAHTYHLGNKQLRGITGSIIAWMFPNTYAGIPEDVLAEAARHGHHVHSCIEMADIVGATADCPESQAYLDMLEENKMRCIAHEYIVTDGKEFASPIDLVLEDENGEVWLGDIKTTSSLHEEKVRLQLSIYAPFFEMQNPDKKVKGIVEVWLPNQKKYDKKPKWVVLPRTDSEDVEKTIIGFLNTMSPDLFRKYYTNEVATIPTAYLEQMQEIAMLETQAKQIKERQEELRATLLAVCQEYGVKKYENDYLTITRIEASKRTTFDSKTFKKSHPDLFKEFSTETETKESIRITIKTA